jgi:hypothetical protein
MTRVRRGLVRQRAETHHEAADNGHDDTDGM